MNSHEETSAESQKDDRDVDVDHGKHREPQHQKHAFEAVSVDEQRRIDGNGAAEQTCGKELSVFGMRALCVVFLAFDQKETVNIDCNAVGDYDGVDQNHHSHHSMGR